MTKQPPPVRTAQPSSKRDPLFLTVVAIMALLTLVVALLVIVVMLPREPPELPPATPQARVQVADTVDWSTPKAAFLTYHKLMVGEYPQDKYVRETAATLRIKETVPFGQYALLFTEWKQNGYPVRAVEVYERVEPDRWSLFVDYRALKIQDLDLLNKITTWNGDTETVTNTDTAPGAVE